MGSQLLKLGGVLSLGVAVLHVVIVVAGAPAYRYFGAGERMAKASEAGAILPAALTLALASLFTIWGLYGLSGAEVIRRLPLLTLGIIVIGVIYTLRGVVVFPQLFSFATSSADVPTRHIVFSAVSLIIGLAYLIGGTLSWGRIGSNKAAL